MDVSNLTIQHKDLKIETVSVIAIILLLKNPHQVFFQATHSTLASERYIPQNLPYQLKRHWQGSLKSDGLESRSRALFNKSENLSPTTSYNVRKQTL